MKAKVALLSVIHHPLMLPVFWLQTPDSIEEAKQVKPAVFHTVTLLKVGSSQKILSWLRWPEG